MRIFFSKREILTFQWRQHAFRQYKKQRMISLVVQRWSVERQEQALAFESFLVESHSRESRHQLYSALPIRTRLRDKETYRITLLDALDEILSYSFAGTDCWCQSINDEDNLVPGSFTHRAANVSQSISDFTTSLGESGDSIIKGFSTWARLWGSI